jgi:hypothetical protein
VGGDGKCFECGHDLQAPICPKCNPHLEARASDVNVRLLAAAKSAAKALEWEIGGGENPFHSKSLAAFEQISEAITTAESASAQTNRQE